MNVQAAVLDSFNPEISSAFFLAPTPGETAHQHYHRLQYKVDKATLAKLFGPGESYEEPMGFNGTIAVEVWAPVVRLSDGERTGYCTRVRGRKLSDIANEAFKIVDDLVDEYFSRQHDYQKGYEDKEWPENVHWIAIYPVTGGSEGHYVHVDLIMNDGSRKMILLGKTFQGMTHAIEMCNRLISAFAC